MDLSCKCIKKVWADFFEGCNTLSVLIMKECNIETIDVAAFHSLNNLETIDVSHNYLASIPPNLFTQNPRLKEVSLSHNPLTMLQYDSPILVSSSLLHLHMGNCMISELSNTSLSKLPNLQSLDLSYNTLKVLSTDTLLPLERLININLGGNNWICNSDFKRLVCLAYNISNSQPHILRCVTKKGERKVYNSHDQYELCRKLSATKSSVASITSTPKELLDVATDATLRTSVTLFQNTSQEYQYTTAALQENIHKRTNESDKAFTIIISTDPPRPNENKGPENSEDDTNGTQITPYGKRVTKTQETSEAEPRTTPKSETGGWWDVNTLKAVDVATDMTVRTSVTLFQNTSQEYTTAVFQEDVHKRTNESDKVFTHIMLTDPPRPNDNNGMETSEDGASGTQNTPYGKRVTETQVTSEDELRTTPKSETGDRASLLISNVNTLIAVVILPITLGVAVFVSLTAVNYVSKKCRFHHPQHHTQTEANHFALPLLNTQLTADFTRQDPEFVNRTSDVVDGTEYHVYETIL